MTEPPPDSRHPVLFFDGECGLCDRFVTFLFVRDHAHRLRFAPLQSAAAKGRLTGALTRDLTTVILQIGDTSYVRSTAAIRAIGLLGGLWTLVLGLLWVPRPIRDTVYTAIAQRRYALFGKKNACRKPSPEEKPYFWE